GSLGHVTEVLSGDYYEPVSTSSPHQIWSAAMVVNPLLLGLMGLQTNTLQHRFVLAPHTPAGWNSFQIHNIRFGRSTVDVAFSRNDNQISLNLRTTGTANGTFEFAPAISLHARVVSVEINGRPAKYRLQTNNEDQH